MSTVSASIDAANNVLHRICAPVMWTAMPSPGTQALETLEYAFCYRNAMILRFVLTVSRAQSQALMLIVVMTLQQQLAHPQQHR